LSRDYTHELDAFVRRDVKTFGPPFFVDVANTTLYIADARRRKGKARNK
jgi:hypothetical protein